MRYLVTGGAGFIGSNLVDRLLFDGHSVVVIDNESAESNEKFYWNDAAENHKYDILDIDNCLPLFKDVDAVFHLAAEARIQPSIENPMKTIKTNVVGTLSILECARLNGVKRVVYSSTSSAYGLKNIPPLVETMSNDCLNPYSVSKTSGEELCKMHYRLYGTETVILRYFNVYGERQPLKGSYAPIIGIFLRQKNAGEPMTIVGDGEQRRDFTHISDAVEANILAAQTFKTSEWEWGQVYNIGTGKNYSINEIAALYGGDTVNIPPRPAEARVTLADASKAESHLGWKAKKSLEDWILKNSG